MTEFDYAQLSADFAGLSKPAQRALLNNGVRSPKDLAKRTLAEVRAFHGIGPSAIPILEKALKAHGLAFKR